MKFFKIFLGSLFTLLLIISCKKNDVAPTPPVNLVFEAYSDAFTNNGILPKLYTCDSLSISPPIAWKNAPAGTTSYAVTMHSIPVTGDKHVYMVISKIPPTVFSLPQAATNIGVFGINSLNSQRNYSPPCSQGPGFKAYILTVYALSKDPVLPVTNYTMDQLLEAMKTITLASSVLTVNYSR